MKRFKVGDYARCQLARITSVWHISLLELVGEFIWTLDEATVRGKAVSVDTRMRYDEQSMRRLPLIERGTELIFPDRCLELRPEFRWLYVAWAPPTDEEFKAWIRSCAASAQEQEG